MNIQAGFIIKILLLSTGLSYLIKYGGQQILIKPTNSLALIIVLLPSVIIGLILGRKYQDVVSKRENSDEIN
jgi:hypothetical protein